MASYTELLELLGDSVPVDLGAASDAPRIEDDIYEPELSECPNCNHFLEELR